MHNPRYEAVYKSIGVANIARTTDLLIDQIMVNIESPELRKVIGFGDLEINIVNIPEGAAASDVASLAARKGFPREIVVTCIYSDQKDAFVVPRGGTAVAPGDRLFLCGRPKDIKRAARLLRKP
jgi:trk system potassium uptake protein TrkA